MLAGRPHKLGLLQQRSAASSRGRRRELRLVRQRSAQPPLPQPLLPSALVEDLMLRSAIGLALTSLVLAIHAALV